MNLNKQLISILLFYTDIDVVFLQEFRNFLKQLEPEHHIKMWDKSEISMGENTNDATQKALQDAHIVLLLLSSDFLVDKDWNNIKNTVLALSNSGKCRVVPILLRPCIWESPDIKHLKPLPQNKKPITSWADRDSAYKDITKSIKGVLTQIEDHPTPPAQLPPTELRRYTNDQIRQWEKPNCLRPTNTDEVLIELLARRKSVNLTGNSGHGKSRMLQDIRDIAEQQGITVAWGNIKDFRIKYDDFLQNLAIQLDLRPATPYTNFRQIAYDLNLQKQRFFLLMIDNLEVLNDYPNNDPNYNAQFVQSLNFLKNSDNIRLLCASREWLNGVVFEGVTSILTLHQIELSPLSSHEIQVELNRQLGTEHPFLAKPNEQQILHAEVKKSSKPYTLLEQLISQIRDLPPTKI